jgi:hypothetical protein
MTTGILIIILLLGSVLLLLVMQRNASKKGFKEIQDRLNIIEKKLDCTDRGA